MSISYRRLKLLILLLCLYGFSNPVLADFLIIDDLIVDASQCLGNSCVNGETFGFDTLKLKENNLRIKFQDVSVAGGYPSNDWEITVNDTVAGGLNHFSITDVTGNRVPFRIEAGAATSSLYIDSGSRVGLGTNNPAEHLHIVSDDTPTLRLEQDNSSGFSTQTWDVAGNEASFFVRDFTAGETYPFRIRPGNRSDMLTIRDNRVGVGSFAPANTLHVTADDGTTKVLVAEASATAASRTLLELINRGNTKMSMTNTDAGVEWSFSNPGTGFRISRQGSGEIEFDLANNGDLEIAGLLTENSDRNVKTNIINIDPQEILNKVQQLPIRQWQYKDAIGENHIGPMAQDFYQAFRLGKTDKGIATLDSAGVALAAIKALAEKNQQLEATQQRLLDALTAERKASQKQAALQQQTQMALAELQQQFQRQQQRLVELESSRQADQHRPLNATL